KVETFAALRLAIDNWRWQGVPFFIRAGKSLPVTCTEVIVHLRRPPPLFGSCQPQRDYYRLRINPVNEVAIGVNVMDTAQAGVGQAAELLAHRTLCGRGVAYRRSGLEGGNACIPLRSRYLGTEGGRGARTSGRLAQPARSQRAAAGKRRASSATPR